MSSETRSPAVAGAFYPGEPAELAKMIAEMLAGADKPFVGGDIVGLISPHAGYVYSGPVAAHAYKSLQGLQYKDVIIVAPSHVEAFMGAAIYPGDFYKTPLGKVKINKELSAELATYSRLVNLDNAGHSFTHRGEHSLEVQLPFLQTLLGDFNLVAVVMGNQDMETCRGLAESIAEGCKNRDDILIVASSDLSHFHDYGTASVLDNQVVDLVDNYDYDKLFEQLQQRKVEACGGGPIVTVMMACEKLGAGSAKVVKYANSGDVAGDRSSVVGYMAAIIYKGGQAEKVYEINMDETDREPKDDDSDVEVNPASSIDFGLTENEKKMLLDLAHNSIAATLKGDNLELDEAYRAGVLQEKRGAFVTLTIKGRLRGCIGYIKGVKPLCETIAEMAVQAAFHDPRFTALTATEFELIDIEISVLTPMTIVKDQTEVEVGRDGLYMVHGYNSGLLLPQVPVENNWDKLTFLSQTCLKAGLSPDAWKQSETQIYRFQADIFGGKTTSPDK
ncbi:MAG: AmmeMemoRadiSam system protein B [candidate division Zixibacteria bacterium]|nr:AmmeMemoRadiSam system protein B [candidate division Zixibacteria bacterium]